MSASDDRWTSIAEDADLTADETLAIAPLFANFMREPEPMVASQRRARQVWFEAHRPASGSWTRRLVDAWSVGLAQVSLFRLPFWIVSIAVVLAGAAAVAAGLDVGRVVAIYLAAPLVACTATWSAFRGQGLAPQELELSTPVSARELILIRLFLILLYDVAIGLLATLPLVIAGTSTLGAITLAWLSPLILATGATLIISTWMPVDRAAALVYSVWVAGVLGVVRLVSLPALLLPSVELAMITTGIVLLAIAAVSLPGRFTVTGSHPA